MCVCVSERKKERDVMKLLIIWDFIISEAGLPKPSWNSRKQILTIGHGGILDSAASGVLGNINIHT